MLMIDREPLRWSGRRERGLGWIEGMVWRDGASEWRQAASRGACGLVIRGRRRILHSAINGLSALYWIEDEGAIYFASRIDPIAQTFPRPLSVDWDAWAAIIALRYPLGERTPFAEISRLAPFSTLEYRRFGRSRRESPTWPWAELEPAVGLSPGADTAVEALRESLSPLDGEILCPLSGGRDSRILFCLLAEAGQAGTAVTVNDDEGGLFEEEQAAPVAAALRVPHERIRARLEAYPCDWEERARRVEYQFVDHAWLVPLARRIEDIKSAVPDGFAIDALLQSGNHFYPPETLEHRRRRGASLAMFDSLRKYGQAQMALTESFHEGIVSRAREQFLTSAAPFEGHPSQAILSLYATRTVRGISTYPGGLLGSRARVIAPAASDPVAQALLAVSSADKVDAAMYRAIFDRLPAAARLPSTSDTARRSPRLPRRWCSEPAIELHRRSLAEGPLSDHISTQLQAWLAMPERGELPADLRMGMEAVSLFHAWWRRYRGCLGEVDASALRGD